MIVAIPDGDSGLTVPVLRALGLVPGIRVAVVSGSRWASARYSRLTQSVVTHEHLGPENLLESMDRSIGRSGANVVLPVGLPAIECFSAHQIRRLGRAAVVPTPPVEAFRTTSCKRAFAQWIKETDVPAPPTLLGEEAMTPGAVETRLGFPVLIKPRRGLGGSGIRLCRNRSELESAFGRSRLPQEFIVQRYLRGHDWTCNVLCLEGSILAATVTRHLFTSRNPFAPGEGVEFVEEPEILRIARKVMARLHWTGVANLDLRHDEETGRFVLLEINPRFWRNTALSALAGVNFPHLACLTALGGEVAVARQRPVRVAKFREAIRRRLREAALREPHGYDLSEVPMVLSDPMPFFATAAKWGALRLGLSRAVAEPDPFARKQWGRI